MLWLHGWCTCCLLSRLRPDAKARRARRSPSGAGRETKRSRGNGVGAKKLDSHLSRPLMRSSNPDLAVPSAAAFLRECRLTIGGAALVHYVLGCIGPPLLRLLHHGLSFFDELSYSGKLALGGDRKARVHENIIT